MAKNISKGKCSFCKSLISKSVMTRHLQACKERKESEKDKNKNYFHIVVEGTHHREYWVHLEVLDTSKLITLDNFLRDLWLECCGHLSMFTIDGIKYSSDLGCIEEFDDESMNISLKKVLCTGLTFSYEYDFGSTTDLRLKVVDEREISGRKDSITILARNEPPEILCSCGKKATKICCQCIYEGKGWHCAKCAKKHRCGEEMFSPVVNSPRTGVCGYCG